MKIIVKNSDFTFANAKYSFHDVYYYDNVLSRIISFDTGDENINGEYNLIRFSVPAKATMLRISGSFKNTAVAVFKDLNGNTIDVVTSGIIQEYTLNNRIIYIPNGTATIDVCHYKNFEKPIVQYSLDVIENQSFQLGNSYISNTLLTYNTGVPQYSFAGYKTVLVNVEGIDRIRISGTYRNTCAAVFYSDRNLSEIISIGLNNNGILGDYTLVDKVVDVPSSAIYMASCVEDKASMPTIIGLID